MTRARRSSLTGMAVVLALAVGCSRCHSTRPPAVTQPEDLLPAGVDSVVLVPQLSRLGAALLQVSHLRLSGLLAALAGEGDAASALNDLRSQLGVDLTSAPALDALGVAPAGPALVATLPDRTPLLVVRVSDAGRFEAAVAKLAKERLRAAVRTEEKGVVRFSSATDPNANAVFAYAGSYAVLSLGHGALAAVTKTVAQKPEQALSADPTFRALAAASSEATIASYIPSTSTLAPSAGLGQGLTSQLTIDPHDVRVAVDAALSPAQAAGLAMTPGAGEDLLPALDADPVLLARLGADPGPLWVLAEPLVPRDFRQMLLNAGLKAREIAANLQPGMALTLSLPGQLDLSHLPSLDPRLTNPFRYLYLAALGRAKDPAAARATLDEAHQFDKQLGAEIRVTQQGNDPVYTFAYELGEGASIALDGSEVAISGGDGRLSPLLGRLHATDGGPALPPDSAARFASSGSAVYLDLDRLADRIRALPSSAFGLGGFAIRAALMRWVDAVNDLHHLLLTADCRDGHLHLELRAGLP